MSNNITFDGLKVSPLPKPIILKRLLENYNRENNSSYDHDVFISYSNKDEQHALKVEKMLADYGIRTWRDNLQIRFGDKIQVRILESLLKTREMCVIVSQNAANSTWVANESGAAWVLGKVITPIITIDEKDIPPILKETRYVKGITKKSIAEYAKDVIERRDEQDAANLRGWYRK